MTRLVTADDLCVAAESTLRTHLPAVIAQLGWDPAAVAELEAAARFTPFVAPKAWAQVPTLEALTTANFPAGAVTSPGLVDVPVRTGRWGTGHNATWRISVGIYDRGGSYDETATRVRKWAGLVRATLLNNPTLGGVASSLMWRGEEYRQITVQRAARTLGGCAVAFDVTSENVVDLTDDPSVTSASPTVLVKE